MTARMMIIAPIGQRSRGRLPALSIIGTFQTIEIIDYLTMCTTLIFRNFLNIFFYSDNDIVFSAVNLFLIFVYSSTRSNPLRIFIVDRLRLFANQKVYLHAYASPSTHTATMVMTTLTAHVPMTAYWIEDADTPAFSKIPLE